MARKGRAAATAQRDGQPSAWRQVVGLAGVLFVIGGGSILGVAASAQQHAPQPAPSASGTIGPAGTIGPVGTGQPPGGSGVPAVPRSEPVSIAIPAIGVQSNLLHLGLNPNGTIQVPSLYAQSSRAAWYKYSPTPGQIGASVIEGHIDTYQGPSVFFRLGSLRPGNQVDITLADGIVAVFKVTGVRSYPKASWPWHVVFGSGDYPALHLITCGGTFDFSTRQYMSNTVVFASLISSRTASPAHG